MMSTQINNIGVKIWNILEDKEYFSNENIVEIMSRDFNIHFRRKNLEPVKKIMKGKKLSMHTMTKDIFYETDSVLRDLELSVLKSEVLVCKYLNCKELIVHLKNKKLTKKEIKSFSELILFAKRNDVKILYENGENFDGKIFLYNLEKLKLLNVALDLGHLNTAIKNEKLNIELKKFLKKVEERVVYVHVHNNFGKDEHFGINKGNLNWRFVLDNLDLNKIKKIIIEVNDYKYIADSKKILSDYLKKRKSAHLLS